MRGYKNNTCNNAIIDPIGLATIRREIQFISDHPVAVIHLRCPSWRFPCRFINVTFHTPPIYSLMIVLNKIFPILKRCQKIHRDKRGSSNSRKGFEHFLMTIQLHAANELKLASLVYRRRPLTFPNNERARRRTESPISLGLFARNLRIYFTTQKRKEICFKIANMINLCFQIST